MTDTARVEDLSNRIGTATAEIAKVIVGQTDVVEQLLIALFARGHCLLVGVPGLAKTLLVRSLAETRGTDLAALCTAIAANGVRAFAL